MYLHNMTEQAQFQTNKFLFAGVHVLHQLLRSIGVEGKFSFIISKGSLVKLYQTRFITMSSQPVVLFCFDVANVGWFGSR